MKFWIATCLIVIGFTVLSIHGELATIRDDVHAIRAHLEALK